MAPFCAAVAELLGVELATLNGRPARSSGPSCTRSTSSSEIERGAPGPGSSPVLPRGVHGTTQRFARNLALGIRAAPVRVYRNSGASARLRRSCPRVRALEQVS